MTAETAQTLLRESGLPAAWAGEPLWRVLETEFGDGGRFLALWAAWLQDPNRPALLHHVAMTAEPPAVDGLLGAIQHAPSLAPLLARADALHGAWQGLLPGFHRLGFEDGQVQLTLCVGSAHKESGAGKPHDGMRDSLRELAFEADTVWLTSPVMATAALHPHLPAVEPTPSTTPATSSVPGSRVRLAPLDEPAVDPNAVRRLEAGVIKALSALCRRGTHLATLPVPASARGPLRAALESCGFDVAPAAESPDAPASLNATHNPRWTPRKAAQAIAPLNAPGHCFVIGGGLAGASTAYSLARRGWQVTVLDRGAEPAAGASGLPAGLVAPHVSADDRSLSRLTRNGVRATLERARELLREGVDWQLSGVLEHRVKDSRDLPPDWLTLDSPGRAWSHPATADQLAQAGLPTDRPAHWHARARLDPPGRAGARHARATWRHLARRDIGGPAGAPSCGVAGARRPRCHVGGGRSDGCCRGL